MHFMIHANTRLNQWWDFIEIASCNVLYWPDSFGHATPNSHSTNRAIHEWKHETTRLLTSIVNKQTTSLFSSHPHPLRTSEYIENALTVGLFGWLLAVDCYTSPLVYCCTCKRHYTLWQHRYFDSIWLHSTEIPDQSMCVCHRRR